MGQLLGAAHGRWRKNGSAGAGVTQGDTAAYTAAGAGYQGDFVGEGLVH